MAVPVAVHVAEGVEVPYVVLESVPVGVGVGVTVAELEALAPVLRLAAGEGVAEGGTVSVVDGVSLAEGVSEEVGEGEGVGSAVPVLLGVPEGLAEPLSLTVGEPLAVEGGDAPKDSDAVGILLSLGGAAPVALLVGVPVPEPVFVRCGWGRAWASPSRSPSPSCWPCWWATHPG